MATPQTRVHFTEAEYLSIERASEERHEYLDGRIRAMAGESDQHGELCVSLTLALGSQLKGTACRVRAQNTKVRSGPDPQAFRHPEGFYSYPDVLVVCGERKFHDQFRDVLLNPQVIIEVLSKTTESFDRGEKFIRYRTWLPSLTDYLLVAQDKPVIEHYRRQTDGEWLLATYTGLAASLVLRSIDCTLKLSEVYDQVEFPALSSETSANESTED